MKIHNIKNFLQHLVKEKDMFCTFRTKDMLFVTSPSVHFILPCDPTMWAYKKCPEQALAEYMPFLPQTARMFIRGISEDEIPQATCDVPKQWEALNKMVVVDSIALTPFHYEFGEKTYRIFSGTYGVRYFIDKVMCDCLEPRLLRYAEEYHYQLLENGWIRVLQYVKTTSTRDAGQYAPVMYVDATTFHATERI